MHRQLTVTFFRLSLLRPIHIINISSEISIVESVKAPLDIYSPITDIVIEIKAVLEDQSKLNIYCPSRTINHVKILYPSLYLLLLGADFHLDRRPQDLLLFARAVNH